MTCIARKALIAMLCLGSLALGLWLGSEWWNQRRWFALQAGQLATIRQLEAFPPAGWDERAWGNALVTPYNVWGNVTYTPAYSRITIPEMRDLQSQLDQIVAETTRENSAESVDRVFALLAQRGQKTDFITGYRDEFRDFHALVRQGLPNSVSAQTIESISQPPDRAQPISH